MDILQVEFFEFDHDLSYEAIKNIWIERDLWFFAVEKNQKLLHRIALSDGKLLTEADGKVAEYATAELANQTVESKKLENTKLVERLYEYYTAKNDMGRFIANSSGQPLEFLEEETALRFAISYNNDLVKIRQSAANYMTKKSADQYFIPEEQ